MYLERRCLVEWLVELQEMFLVVAAPTTLGGIPGGKPYRRLKCGRWKCEQPQPQDKDFIQVLLREIIFKSG